nr:hypothetical protein [uncultured Methanoregula sp.]
MTRINIALVLQCVTLLIPLNLYVVGDWLGSGIQWALFRFQYTYAGTSIIPFTSDLGYIISGTITGRTAFSMFAGVCGSCLLIAAFCLVLFSRPAEQDKRMKIIGILTIAGGLLFLGSSLIQYGIFLNGPAGLAIPVGIPLVLIIGWIAYSGFYLRLFPNDEESGEEDDESENSPGL